MRERDDLIVLGRLIGTYTGWDEGETAQFIFYEYEPADGIALPSGDLWVHYDEGYFQFYDEHGNVIRVVDMIDVMRYAPRAKELSNG